MPDTHYLDYNATSPMRPDAKAAILDVLGPAYNASSAHSLGRKAKHLLENSRKTLADCVSIGLTGTPSAHVIFTSSGTEANNLALKAFDDVQIITMHTEHPSILQTAQSCAHPPSIINVDSNGIIKLDHLEHALKTCDSTKPILVSAMMANNETGILQPMTDIIALAKSYKALVHSDAVQAFGKIPVDMTRLDIDMLTLSSHKIGGPQGCAALLIRKNVPHPITKQHHGGGQEFGFRSGTENVAAIHGFSIAARQAITSLDQESQRITRLRDQLEHDITSYASDAVIIGHMNDRLPNTSCICLPDVKSETQLIHFDLANIAVSTGSACSSGKVEASHVLAAMGHDKHITGCALRVSIGFDTKKEDINQFIIHWKKLYDTNRGHP